MTTLAEPENRDSRDNGGADRMPGRLLLVLAPLASFGPLSMDLYLPALPAMARHLHASDSAAQWTMSACMIGLATGQLVAGGLSDRFGRRRPALIGVGLFAVLSVACALAPSVGVLIGLRLLQGMAGAACIVVARAVVRDLVHGAAAARAFSLLGLVGGIAPVCAPLIGGQIARFAPWQGQFVVLAGIGVAIWLLALLGLPESLPPQRRHSGGLAATVRGFGPVLRDPGFVRHAAVLALGMTAMFTYISTSSLVLQGRYGLSAQAFSLIFATNALGIVLMGAVNASVVGRIGPARMLRVTVPLQALAALLLVAGALAGWGVAALLPPLFVVVAAQGSLTPNATALAMARHGRAAGTASAVLGLGQFLVGALVAPIAGIGGATALSMSAVIVACAWLGLAALLAPGPGRAPEDR